MGFWKVTERPVYGPKKIIKKMLGSSELSKPIRVEK